jgi:hypothetical protein
MAAHENLSGQQFWRNEQGDFEAVTPEVYAQKRAELKQQNQHAINRGDRFFKDE